MKDLELEERKVNGIVDFCFYLEHRNQQIELSRSLQGCVVLLLWGFRGPRGEKYGDGQTASRIKPYVRYDRYT